MNLVLEITKNQNGYSWNLFHPEGFGGECFQGEKPSIAAALAAGFNHIAVGEGVIVGLTMGTKRGGCRLVKGSESPDTEKGASVVLSKLR